MMESKTTQHDQIIFLLILPVLNHYDSYSLREFILLMTAANVMLTLADHTLIESTAAVPLTESLVTFCPTVPPVGKKQYTINK